MRTRTSTCVAIAAAATLLVSSAATALTESTLPGGTSISVDNTSPTDGAEFLVPIGDATTSVTDTGTASVGAAEVVKDTSLMFVIDVSGSTSLSAGVNCDGVAGVDTRLVCEKVGALTANTAAAQPFSAIANAGVVSFQSTAAIVTPLTTNFAATAAGINGLAPGGNTDYEAALNQAKNALVPSTQANHIVLFLSDGQPIEGNLNNVTAFGSNTTVKAFAIGAPAVVSCSGTAGQDLNAVAAKGNAESSCQQVSDPSTLGDVIAEAIGASLDALDINVDGGGFNAIPAVDVDISLPTATTFAPKTANWSTSVTGLAPGLHTICVRATGTDVGGTESVQDCKSIRMLQLQNDGTDVDATNELGIDDTHTISVDVAGDIGGRDVTFDVTGVNGTAGGVVQTDADGKASFTYSSPQDPSGLGDDEITVSITVDGETQTLTFDKEWVDTTPPTAACVESVNPGGTVPAAPGKGGQAQNQDGFYEISGSDDIWPDDSLQVFVRDSGSGTLFGPFAVGTDIKYTEDGDATPESKSIGGPNSPVQVHIIGNGDAEVLVVDGSGNTSDAADCLVPPPPM